MDDFLSALGNIVIIRSVLGLVYSFVLVFLWEKVLKRFWYKFKYRHVKVKDGYILLLLPKEHMETGVAQIENQFEGSLQHLKGLHMEKCPIPENCSSVTPHEVIGKMKRIRNHMAKDKRLVMHLFYSGPVALSAFIGGYFFNKGCVFIYQRNRETGEYDCWGPLNQS